MAGGATSVLKGGTACAIQWGALLQKIQIGTVQCVDERNK